MLELINNISPRYKTEGIVLNWLLHYIRKNKVLSPDKMRNVEDAFFDHQTVEWILTKADFMVRTKAFKTLDPACFESAVDLLIHKWPTLDKGLYEAGLIISAHRPESAVAMFNGFLASPQKADPDHTAAILRCLHRLPENQAMALFEKTYRSFTLSSGLEDTELFVLGALLVSASAIDHPELNTIARAIFSSAGKKDRDAYDERLKAALSLLQHSFFDVRLIEYLMDNPDALKTDDLVFLYGDIAAAGAIVDRLRDLGRRRFGSVLAFAKDLKPDGFKNHLLEFLIELAEDGHFLKGLHKKKHRPVFFKILMAVALAGHLRQSPSFDDLDTDAIIALLQCNLLLFDDTQLLPQVVACLKSRDRDIMIQSLQDALTRSMGTYGAENIMAVMGEFDDARLIQSLIQLMADPSAMNPHSERIVDALARYGECILGPLQDILEKIPDQALMGVMQLLENIDSPMVIPIVNDHFERFYKADREALLDLIKKHPTGPWLDRLRPKISKGQSDIDRTYLLLSMVNGTMTKRDGKLLEQYNATEAKKINKIESMFEGRLEALVEKSLNLKLHCKSCGDESCYDVYHIYINPEAKGIPYIGGELTCVNCNQESDFEITSEGYQAILAILMSLMVIKKDDAKKSAAERSPVKLLPVMIQGKTMDIGEGIKLYQRQLKKDPDSPETHIGLANIFRHTAQSKKAKALYHQAIRLDPNYIECYFNLAKIAATEGDHNGALDQIYKGLPFLKTAKAKNAYDGTTVEDMRSAYLDFYYSLSDPEGYADLEYIPPASRANDEKPRNRKIGRNAPCPCGSGKKYKKCCLNASSS
ncbi:SEC-C metal-binding domain-containing protein [Desulfosarcina variabilis]|uniref:SEC-C metal-binding domain-containing protein n=1 Tax=Desulfosarcina variabilis TaxID=2300 RepID=UPI003AFA967A